MRLAFVFDTETTGLIENRTTPLDKLPHIISFCGVLVDLDNGAILNKYDTYIRPPIYIPDFITKINGITDEMVSKEGLFEVHADPIREIIEAAPCVIAHNAVFDTEMVDIEIERLGRTKIAWPYIICTIEQTMHYVGRRMTLTVLHEHLFGEKFPGAHSAFGDVMALVRIAVELHKRGDI